VNKLIDFHSHVLPNIDDGANSLEVALDMLKLSKAQGVETVLATPHFLPEKQSVEDFIRRRDEAFHDLQSYSNRMETEIPSIKLGAEVQYSPELFNLSSLNKLCIENTNTLLLELPFTYWNDWLYYSLFELTVKSKVKIVLAHLERYVDNKQSFKKLEPIFDMNVFIQLNCDSILSFQKRSIIDLFFKKYRVDAIGSDMHNLTKRTTHMDQTKKRIIKKYGEGTWKAIMKSTETLIG